MGTYNNILYLKHPTSKIHSPMPLQARAAQFAPFSALSGYDSAISEEARRPDEKQSLGDEQAALLDETFQYLTQHLSEKIEVEVTYFVPDPKKPGGKYVKTAGTLRQIEPTLRTVTFYSGFILSLDDIFEVKLLTKEKA